MLLEISSANKIIKTKFDKYYNIYNTQWIKINKRYRAMYVINNKTNNNSIKIISKRNDK